VPVVQTGSGWRTFPFGGGQVAISEDGAVAAVEHPTRDHSMLLEEDAWVPESVMHSSARRWGKGFVIADGRGHRFDRPEKLRWTPDGVELSYHCGPLRLDVHRSIGEWWSETYELTNGSEQTVDVGSFALSTPWRDVYGSSGDSLRRAVHAHLWTGGADSWVWAVPMDGTGPGLGLTVTEGELWAYSVESRDSLTGSNVRGHLYLHTTDRARAPHAMGGQPAVVLAPGQTTRLSWQLGWYPDLPEFHAAQRPLVSADRLAVDRGAPLPLRVTPGARLSVRLPVATDRVGLHHLDAVLDTRRSRIAVLVTGSLRDVAEARAAFLLEYQRQPERSDSRRHAFVPVDTRSKLTVLPGAWGDWSAGRERVGSALFLQELRRRGWGDTAAVGEGLAGYRAFVVEHLVTADGTVLDDPVTAGGRPPRLYDFPWFARFLLDEGDLTLAASIMQRFYALGGGKFLAFELGGVIRDLAEALRAAGRDGDADDLTGHLLDQARTFLAYGEDLPAHEVNYEQSMVAPLLDLLLAARRVTPGIVQDEELRRRLRWLTAFAADQPDVRLRDIPIRHWDGYWFGGLRLWGDVFPHHWSVLSAATYLAWPAGLLTSERTAALRGTAYSILRANLVSFDDDGGATCAFVYPSCVNGQPAHVRDPLANDQDWALVYALRHGLGPNAPEVTSASRPR